MTIQDQLNTAFIADDSDSMQELESVSLIRECYTSKNSPHTLADGYLNVSFIENDSEFWQEWESISSKDMPR